MGKKEKQAGGGAIKSKTANDNEDVRRDQKLQAILLADSFEKTFRPVTWEVPKVLMPLVNVPLLEYTIEFLAQSGVEEVLAISSYLSQYANVSSFLILNLYFMQSAFRFLCLASRYAWKLHFEIKVDVVNLSSMYYI